jgi:hypothetical protein
LYTLEELEACLPPVVEKAAYIPPEDYIPADPKDAGEYWLGKFLAKAYPGCRNDVGFKLALQLRDSGLSEGQARPIMRKYQARVEAGNDPYTVEEASGSLKAAYSGQPRTPAAIPTEKKNIMEIETIEAPPEFAPVDHTLHEERPDPWKMFTLADAYSERPPVQYVAKGIFKLPSLNIVYGPPGCLKSFLMADFALCVASGQLWLPSAPWQPGRSSGIETTQFPVMWLDFDMGSDDTHERIEALARARNLPTDTPFYYYSMPMPWLDASKKESIGMLVLRANRLGVKLIIIDNLGTVSGGVEENSGAMIGVMSLLRQLTEETRAAVNVIHHQRKGNGFNGRAGDTLRGHSSIEASLNLALQVDREEDIMTIKSTKTRGVDVKPFSAAFTFEHKDNGDLETAKFYGLEVEDMTSNDAVAREIRTALTGCTMNKGELTKAVKEILEVGINRIRNTIEKMAADGAIRVHTTPDKRSSIFSL